MSTAELQTPRLEIPFGKRTRRVARASGEVDAEHMEAREAARRLSASPIFAHVSRARLAQLADGAVVRRLRAGDLLWSADAKAEHVVLIEAGLLRLGRSSVPDESTSYGVFGPGELLGMFASMDSGRYPTDATAVSSRAVVIQIRSGALTEAIGREASLGLAVNRALLQFTSALHAKIDIVSAGSVPKRLAALMLYLVKRFGRERDERCADLPLPLTREHLGELIGARFETVVRTLTDWTRAGWIRTTSEGFEMLRMDLLRQTLKGA